MLEPYLGPEPFRLQSLEPERFRSDYLVQLHRGIAGSHGTASKAIARLQQLASIRESERNSAVIPLALFLFGYVGFKFRTWHQLQVPRLLVGVLLLALHARLGAPPPGATIVGRPSMARQPARTA